MKTLLALLLLIPSLSWGNNLTDKQISFTLFGFTIDEEFKKNQYQLKTLNPYQNNSDGKKCKIVDNESNYDYSCYVRTVTETWLLDEIKPPPEANATKAGAPKILFVEHCVARIEIVNPKEF